MKHPNAAAMPQTASRSPSHLLTEEESAALLGLSQRTLTNWRWKGCGPRWVKVGKRVVRYRRADLEAFLAAGEKAA